MDKYFFLDRSSLQPQAMDNVRLRVIPAEKDTVHNPMFTEGFFAEPSLKWEVRYDNAYPNVIYDPKYKKYRCFYTLFTKDVDSANTPREERAKRDYKPLGNRITSLAYAESDDGVHWVKPNLGLVDFEGSKENNLLFRYAHGTGIFLDLEERDPAKRYKLVTKVEYPGQHGFMAVNFSEDGLHWGEMIRWPRWNPQADSHNFPFRDKSDGMFKVITRIWKDGVRVSCVSSSPDFINWSEPKEIIRGDGFASQVYSMPVFRYDGIYLGLASMYHEGDRSEENFDTVDLELACATTMDRFDRVAPYQYLIERGAGHYPDGEFDCACIYAAAPLDMGDDKLCIYYMGGNGRHTNFRETSFGRCFVKKDRFACYEAKDPAKDSQIGSCRFNIYGNRFAVLAEGGEWSAALCPSWREKPYEGFGFEDCVKSVDADGYTTLHWGREMMELETATVCLMLRFKGGTKVYGFRGDVARQGERYYEGAPMI